MSATCTDPRCSEGIGPCTGCNGWGVMRANGKRIRLRRDTIKYPLADTLPQHHECNGTGLVDHGCTTLSDDMRMALAGTVRAEAPRRWSTVTDGWVTVPVVAPVVNVPIVVPAPGKAGNHTVSNVDKTLLLTAVNGRVKRTDMIRGQRTRMAEMGLLSRHTRKDNTVSLTDRGKTVRTDILAAQHTTAVA